MISGAFFFTAVFDREGSFGSVPVRPASTLLNEIEKGE